MAQLARAYRSIPGAPPVAVVREQTDAGNSQRSTAQTASRMCEHIRRDTQSAIVRRTAASILAAAPAKDPYGLACAVWLWVKSHVRFESDESQITRLFGTANGFELLIAPAVLLASPNPSGDCDDFSMLECALLAALGVDCQLVCVCANELEPKRFSHVYARAFIPAANNWLTIDASHGTAPGWEVPASRIHRKQCWALTGRCVSDVVTMPPAPAGMGAAAELVGPSPSMPMSGGSQLFSRGFDYLVWPGEQITNMLGLPHHDMIDTWPIVISAGVWAVVAYAVLGGGRK